MNGPAFVHWMEREGWSVAGLAAALDGQVSQRTLWRWRSGKTAMPAVWDRALLALRTKPEERVLHRWPEKAETR